MKRGGKKARREKERRRERMGMAGGDGSAVKKSRLDVVNENEEMLKKLQQKRRGKPISESEKNQSLARLAGLDLDVQKDGGAEKAAAQTTTTFPAAEEDRPDPGAMRTAETPTTTTTTEAVGPPAARAAAVAGGAAVAAAGPDPRAQEAPLLPRRVQQQRLKRRRMRGRGQAAAAAAPPKRKPPVLSGGNTTSFWKVLRLPEPMKAVATGDRVPQLPEITAPISASIGKRSVARGAKSGSETGPRRQLRRDLRGGEDAAAAAMEDGGADDLDEKEEGAAADIQAHPDPIHLGVEVEAVGWDCDGGGEVLPVRLADPFTGRDAPCARSNKSSANCTAAIPSPKQPPKHPKH